MKKDDSVFLKHILESIKLIELYINGINEKQFLKALNKPHLDFKWGWREVYFTAD